MKLFTLIGVSAAITGAIATTGNSSITVSVVSTTRDSSSRPTDIDVPVPSKEEVFALFHGLDQTIVSYGNTDSCDTASFGAEHRLFYNACYPVPGLLSTRARHIRGVTSQRLDDTCVLAAFDESDCSGIGTIIAEFESVEDMHDPEDNTALCVYDGSVPMDMDGENTEAVKWVCGPGIDEDWENPRNVSISYPMPDDSDSDDDDDNQLIFARSVDTELSRDHVTVSPADGLNCNSAQHRDTDTKVHGHCHSFDKPFSSLSATIKRAGHSKVGGSEPCSVLVFSDMDCTKDGAQVVDLNDTGALGVCHNFALHHGNDLGTAIAGHSWKWVCGRQEINDCINPKASKHHTKASTTSVKKGKTLTVTATTSLACSLTTEAAHSLDVITSVVTQEPVTHTITSVFTKTQLRVRTKLITSVATAVSTVRHTVTKPFSTTYKVCDVEASAQS